MGPWLYAAQTFLLAFAVGIVCDLAVCTPVARRLGSRLCRPDDRPVWRGTTVKFAMVVLMMVAMTVFGALAAVGLTPHAGVAFITMLPYNFVLALPLQMLLIAPLAGRLVHVVGNRRGWHSSPVIAASPGRERVGA